MRAGVHIAVEALDRSGLKQSMSATDFEKPVGGSDRESGHVCLIRACTCNFQLG
jgi:hypothetical protein